jgi:hypothetical protein
MNPTPIQIAARVAQILSRELREPIIVKGTFIRVGNHTVNIADDSTITSSSASIRNLLSF